LRQLEGGEREEERDGDDEDVGVEVLDDVHAARLTALPFRPRISSNRAVRTLIRASTLGGLTLGLLVLAAVGSRQEGWGGGGGGGSLRDVPYAIIDSAYTLLVVGLVALFVAMILSLRRAWPEFRHKRTSAWQAAVLLVACAGIAAYVLANTHVGDRLSKLLAGASGGGRQPNANVAPGDPGGPAHDPRFQWWLAVLVAAAAAAGYVWYKRTHKRPRPRARNELAEQLELVLSDTLEDLESERDPRRAVIRAYARMETVLAAHGLPRNPAEAPLEYLARVLRELHVRAAAAHALTELFERAKFSQHEIDRARKDEAIAALATVRDDLKAAA
jgi:hypothetical protein